MEKLLGQMIFFLTGFLFSLSALDPSTEIQNYLKKAWTRENGLPQNTILAIEQTRDGFIWIGTPSGLVRFDGLQFKVFTTDNTPALRNDRIIALHQDIYERLWIGTYGGGLAYLHNNVWHSLSVHDGLSHDHVRTITSDWKGKVWIGTDYGLNCFTADGITSYTSHAGLTDNVITALTIDSQGYLWIGTLRGGLMQFQNQLVRVYGYRQGLKEEAVTALLTDRQDNIWIGTLHGLYFLDRGNEQIQFIRGTSFTPITSLLEDPMGMIWIATMADGLKRMEAGKVSPSTGREGYPADYLHTLFCDRDNNLWIGSDAAGLFQFQDSRMENLTIRDGLPEMAVNAVLQDRQGDLWLGMSTEGVCQLRNGKILKKWNISSGLSSNRTSALLEDSRGIIWIGTRDNGLNYIEDDRIKHLDRSTGLSSDIVTCLLEDQSARLWIGTDRGLNHLPLKNPGGIQQVGAVLPDIQVLFLGKKGQIYVGTRKGLLIYRDDSLQKIEHDSELTELEIISLYEDEQHTLWIGTAGRGLFCLKGDTLRSWNTDQGLPDNHILSICEDNLRFLWLSSYKGVFRIKRIELENFSTRRSRYILPYWFDESDGMASSLCRSEGKPAVWKSTAGRFYYPTAAGVAIFDPAAISSPPTPGRIFIEKVLLEGQPFTLTSPLSFSYPLKHLSIQFAIPDFYSPRKLSCFYQLQGMDSCWIRSSQADGRQADYFDLRPGKYQFSVFAVNQAGFPGGIPATLTFEVKMPFYRNSFFLVFLLLFFLMAGVAIIFIRQRKTIQRKLNKYRTSTLDPRRAEEFIPRLLQSMEQDKIYLQPNLSLKNLSQLLRIHPNHLSRIINQRFGMSFNDFINRYRINEAKQMLLQEDEEKRNILQIMLDTGFYSKSVFNTAFKKFTGLTPSEFKRRNKPLAEK